MPFLFLADLFGIFDTKQNDISSLKTMTFPERDENDTSDNEATSEDTKLLCLSQCNKKIVKGHRKDKENRKLLPDSHDKILSKSEKNCPPIYIENKYRKSNACMRNDTFLQDDGRYATLKIIDDDKKLPSENLISPQITVLDISSPSLYYAFQHIYLSPTTCYIMVVDMTKSPNDQVLEHVVDEIDCSRSKSWKYQGNEFDV